MVTDYILGKGFCSFGHISSFLLCFDMLTNKLLLLNFFYFITVRCYLSIALKTCVFQGVGISNSGL